MRELTKPDSIEGDDRATELIRYWLAHDDHHLSLLLGMWQDAEDCDVDELYAWGNVLSDIAQHIANGLEKSHGWVYEKTMDQLIRHFVNCAKERAPGLEGDYL